MSVCVCVYLRYRNRYWHTSVVIDARSLALFLCIPFHSLSEYIKWQILSRSLSLLHSYRSLSIAYTVDQLSHSYITDQLYRSVFLYTLSPPLSLSLSIYISLYRSGLSLLHCKSALSLSLFIYSHSLPLSHPLLLSLYTLPHSLWTHQMASNQMADPIALSLSIP